MFHWICPECGREIPPSVMECPACDPKAAALPAPVESASAILQEVTPSAAIEPDVSEPDVSEPDVAPDPLLILAEQIRAAQAEDTPSPLATEPAVSESPGLLELAAAVGVSDGPAAPLEPAAPGVPAAPAPEESSLEPVGAMAGTRYPAPYRTALQPAPSPIALLAPPVAPQAVALAHPEPIVREPVTESFEMVVPAEPAVAWATSDPDPAPQTLVADAAPVEPVHEAVPESLAAPLEPVGEPTIAELAPVPEAAAAADKPMAEPEAAPETIAPIDLVTEPAIEPAASEPVAERAAAPIEAVPEPPSAEPEPVPEPVIAATQSEPVPEPAAAPVEPVKAAAPAAQRTAAETPPSGSWLPLAPLQDYSPTSGRAIHRVAPRPAILMPDSGPRITLPGPTLPPELASLQNASVVTILGGGARQRRRGVPGWVVTIGVMLALLVVGIGVVFYLLPLPQSNADTKAAPPDVQATAASHPLARFIEVTGFRFVVDFNKKSEIHYLVVNHSAAELSDMMVYVTLRAAGAKPGQPPLCRFSFRAPSLGPFESREMTSAIEKPSRSITLPEWQELHSEVQVAQ